MADDGTHAASGVAASEWLPANLGGVVVDTGGTGDLLHLVRELLSMLSITAMACGKEQRG